MELSLASKNEFLKVHDFYWETIDLMKDRTDTVGWKKGIYPADRFIEESIDNGELYVIRHFGGLSAGVILNSRWNEGYEGVPWSILCGSEDVLVPHALAVHPLLQGQGIGKKVVRDIIDIAKARGMKTVRLDILDGNIAAEKLYTGMGFRFVQAKEMFYEDTGWTGFSMYEMIL